MKKEEIQGFANRLMFRIEEDEMSVVDAEFAALEDMLLVFDEIDTTNVKEMIYPFEEETMYMRQDEEQDTLSSEDALRNAPVVKAGHVQLPKVVK